MRATKLFSTLIPIAMLAILPAGSFAAGDDFQTAEALIKQYQPALPSPDGKIEYQDLNGDGNPDVLKTTVNDFPIQWISDDGKMRQGDTAGNCVNCCLMVDRNHDGQYGGPGDLVVQWIDTNDDGKADMQIIADNGSADAAAWGKGQYMIVLDTDGDGVFNYVDWKTMQVKCWEHSGQCRFYTDYIGKSAFLKMHASSFAIKDLRYNWENPFLFYDPDNDGLTEMAIRFCDSPAMNKEPKPLFEFSKRMTLAYTTFDLDNDNAPGNEFDYDMSIGFTGPGFDYQDQVHKFTWKRCVEADKLFFDPRFRQLTELIYPDHDSAWDLIFKRGKWDHISFVFDEDHDCKRWERVEFYGPGDPFKVGVKNGGIDANSQADVSGDRGEWDLTGHGGGKLYVGKFDGRIHLYGADWGAWRIDQDAVYYQGWSRSQTVPDKFPTVKYTDTNKNGFIDTIEYDMDGDATFERKVSLIDLGIDDRCDIIDTSKQTYQDLHLLYEKVAAGTWKHAEQAVQLAKKSGIETNFYSAIMHPLCTREKDQFGYWLQYYIYQDLRNMYQRKGDNDMLGKIDRAYYTGNWQIH